MTHSACGECKHCEMREKNQDKLYLSAIFSSGYKYTDLFRCSAVYWGGCDTAVTGLKDVRQRVVFLVFEISFPHRCLTDAVIFPFIMQYFETETESCKGSVFQTQLCRETTVCKMAENEWAYHYHVIEWLSAQTCCFCRILCFPVKEMTQWYGAGAHSWSPVIAHMGIRGDPFRECFGTDVSKPSTSMEQ